jgi:hypothetical protein
MVSSWFLLCLVDGTSLRFWFMLPDVKLVISNFLD